MSENQKKMSEIYSQMLLMIVKVKVKNLNYILSFLMKWMLFVNLEVENKEQGAQQKMVS